MLRVDSACCCSEPAAACTLAAALHSFLPTVVCASGCAEPAAARTRGEAAAVKALPVAEDDGEWGSESEEPDDEATLDEEAALDAVAGSNTTVRPAVVPCSITYP